MRADASRVSCAVFVVDVRAVRPDHCVVAQRLERDGFSSSRHHALGYRWSMIFFREPASTFRDHALDPLFLQRTISRQDDAEACTTSLRDAAQAAREAD